LTVIVVLLNQVFDLKSSASLANTLIRLKQIDPEQFAKVFADTAAKAPKLFSRAAMILDFSKTPQNLDAETLASLQKTIHRAGAVLLALTHVTEQQEQTAQSLGIPVVYDNKSSTSQQLKSESALQPREVMVVPKVRSGMQIYAKNKDLIVRGDVNYGSEVIADGSIYVYGSLHGKAITGASGDTSTHTIALSFNPELLAIAGIYVLHENISPGSLGGCVRAYLQEGKIQFMSLSSTSRVNNM
jgi:septum site-determining protein MinC